MSKRALIIVPSQGGDVKQFYWCAHALKMKIYASHAQIVKMRVMFPSNYNPFFQRFDQLEVRFFVEHHTAKEAFSLKKCHSVSTFIMISHSGVVDGPNITYGFNGGYQPWGVYDPLGRDGNPYAHNTRQCKFKIDMLRPPAWAFWHDVGRCVASDGKIILLGCRNAEGSYFKHVANASGRSTYGSETEVWAGDVNTVLDIVRHIEHDQTAGSMKKAVPET